MAVSDYLVYEDRKNEDGIVERKQIIRCMHCLDTVIEVNGKANSSYNEKRIWFINGNKHTYIQAMVCNECKDKALNVVNIVGQVQRATRTTLTENKISGKEIEAVINKYYTLTEIKDVQLLEECKNNLHKQEKKAKEIRR